MYKIAICDDNEIICEEIEKKLIMLQKEMKFELDIDIFFKGEDLEFKLINNFKYDLLILDIELYDLNGIEVGKIVREKMFNEVMHIIYISSKESYAMELTLSIKNGGWIMKKIFSVLLVFTILVLSTNDGFAANTYNSQLSYAKKSSFLINSMLTQKEISQIESEIGILNKHHIDTSIVNSVNVTSRGNEYNLHYKNIDEKVIIESTDNENISIIASDGEKSNVISFTKDGSIIIDGYKVQISQVEQTDMNIVPMAKGMIWKGVKSLSPYGSLTSSDYDDYLSSGKQNVNLGKALDTLTITALAAVIGLLHPYLGIAVTLAGVSEEVYNVLVAVNPKTEYLGCAYRTYIAGASDYKYINKFYANRGCTGTYSKKISYEHFIVY